MKIVMYPARVRKNDNPFITILVDALVRRGVDVRNFSLLPVNSDCDALHVHWLEGVFWGKMNRLYPGWAQLVGKRLISLSSEMKRRNRPVVWTVHNLKPHDFRNDLHRQIFDQIKREFIPCVTDVICMSESVRNLILEAYPELEGKRLHVIPHPSYVGHFSRLEGTLPESAQTFLAKSQGPVLGTFGMLRPYKSVPQTVKALRALDLPFRFVIGGEGGESEVRAISEAIGQDERFLLLARRITDEELVGLTRACDLVICNFQSVLNSGSVLATLSMGRAVLAPALGALIDLEKDIKAPWFNTFEGSITTDVLQRMLSLLPIKGTPNLTAYDPDLVASKLVEVYRQTA